jgi:hypothetical protein
LAEKSKKIKKETRNVFSFITPMVAGFGCGFPGYPSLFTCQKPEVSEGTITGS